MEGRHAASSRGKRQAHHKAREPRPRVEADVAAMIAYDTKNRVETEARAFAQRLSREERLENPALDALRNTGSVVDDFHAQVGIVARGADRQLAFCRLFA